MDLTPAGYDSAYAYRIPSDDQKSVYWLDESVEGKIEDLPCPNGHNPQLVPREQIPQGGGPRRSEGAVEPEGEPVRRRDSFTAHSQLPAASPPNALSSNYSVTPSTGSSSSSFTNARGQNAGANAGPNAGLKRPPKLSFEDTPPAQPKKKLQKLSFEDSP